MAKTPMFTESEETPPPTQLAAIYNPQRRLHLYSRYEEPTHCVSADPHEEAITDPVQHYFGCIEICERPQFFHESNTVWTHVSKAEREKLMLAAEKDHQQLSPTDLNQKLKVKVKERMISVASAIEAHYKRTEVLLEAFAKAPSSSEQRTLARHVEESRVNWMGSKEFEKGIEAVRLWREGDEGGRRATDRANIKPGKYTISERIETGRKELQSFLNRHQPRDEANATRTVSEYTLEHDVHAYLIQFTIQSAQSAASSTPDSTPTTRQFLKPC